MQTIKTSSSTPKLTNTVSVKLEPDLNNPRLVGADRRDSDTKKDSGLESGEVSDASNNEETDNNFFSKLPPYLTVPLPAVTTNVNAEVKVKVENPEGTYDRLPGYMTALSKSSSNNSLKMENDDELVVKSEEQTIDDKNNCDSNNSSCSSKSNKNLNSRATTRSQAAKLNSSVLRTVTESALVSPRRSSRRPKRRRNPSSSSSSSSSGASPVRRRLRSGSPVTRNNGRKR